MIFTGFRALAHNCEPGPFQRVNIILKYGAIIMAEKETTKDWLSLCNEHDKDRYKEEEVYEFSNGRKFKNTDKTAGPYE